MITSMLKWRWTVALVRLRKESDWHLVCEWSGELMHSLCRSFCSLTFVYKLDTFYSYLIAWESLHCVLSPGHVPSVRTVVSCSSACARPSRPLLFSRMEHVSSSRNFHYGILCRSAYHYMCDSPWSLQSVCHALHNQPMINEYLGLRMFCSPTMTV